MIEFCHASSLIKLQWVECVSCCIKALVTGWRVNGLRELTRLNSEYFTRSFEPDERKLTVSIDRSSYRAPCLLTMSKEALPRKRKIRACHRASATRLLNQIDSTLAAPTTDSDKLSQFKLSLNEKLETLKLLDSEIVDLTPEDGLEDEIEQADGYKENVYRALTTIDKVLNATPSPPTTAADVRATTATSIPPRGNKVKLPKLSLPHFAGNVTKWTTFLGFVRVCRSQNDDLTDIDKFNDLRSLLERTAYEAISGLTLSSTNYQEAIDILQKRFGNKQLILKHMEILLNIEAMTSEQNLRGLRRL